VMCDIFYDCFGDRSYVGCRGSWLPTLLDLYDTYDFPNFMPLRAGVLQLGKHDLN